MEQWRTDGGGNKQLKMTGTGTQLRRVPPLTRAYYGRPKPKGCFGSVVAI